MKRNALLLLLLGLVACSGEATAPVVQNEESAERAEIPPPAQVEEGVGEFEDGVELFMPEGSSSAWWATTLTDPPRIVAQFSDRMFERHMHIINLADAELAPTEYVLPQVCGGAWLDAGTSQWTYQPCQGTGVLRAHGQLRVVTLEGAQVPRPDDLPRGPIGDLFRLGDTYVFRTIRDRSLFSDSLTMPRFRVSGRDLPMPIPEGERAEVRRNWTVAQMSFSPTHRRVAIRFHVSGPRNDQTLLFDLSGPEIEVLPRLRDVGDDIHLVGFDLEGRALVFRDGESRALRTWNWSTGETREVAHPILLDSDLPAWLFPRSMTPSGYVYRSGEQDWFVGQRCDTCPVELARTEVHVNE